MNRKLKLIFGITLIALSYGLGDNDFGRSVRLSADDVAEYYYKYHGDLTATDRIARLFDQEIDLLGGNQSFRVITGGEAQSDGFVVEYADSGLRAKVEIVKRGWEIDRLLKIPLVFFIYSNNFKIEAILKLYNRFSDDPQYVNKIEIISNGPCVYQLFENNPYDGGLILSQSQKIALEYKAELSLARQLYKDLLKTCNESEG